MRSSLPDGADQAEPPPPRTPWWRITLAFLLTAAILASMFWQIGGWDHFVHAVRGARWGLLPLPLALLASGIFLSSVRWKLILSTMGYHLPLRRGIHVVLATWPLAVVVPSRAGDLMRAVYIRDVAPPIAGAGSVLVDKLIDIQSLCLFAILGCIVHENWYWAFVAIAILVSLWATFAFVLVFGARIAGTRRLVRIQPKIEQFLTAFVSMRARPSGFLLVSVASACGWANALAFIYSLFVMTSADVSLLDVVSLWPIAIIAGSIPVTIAGMGARDAAFLFLLQSSRAAHVPEAAVFTATLGYSLLGTWLPAIIGLPLLIRMGIHFSRR